MQIRLSQGRPPFGVDLRLTDEEKGTRNCPDGETIGNLQIKGHWIIDHYFGKENLRSQQMAGLIPEILLP